MLHVIFLATRTTSDPEEAEFEQTQCISECCSDLSEPYQPRIDFLTTKKEAGKAEPFILQQLVQGSSLAELLCHKAKCFVSTVVLQPQGGGWLSVPRLRTHLQLEDSTIGRKLSRSSWSMSRVWHIVKPCWNTVLHSSPQYTSSWIARHKKISYNTGRCYWNS